jgi:membrane associated rhomboid family serine protease
MDECGDFITMMIKKTQTPGKHAPWFTMCMVAIYVAIFEFMASEWSILSDGSSWSSGPHNLFRYMDATSHPTQFSSVFLIAWGAQDLRLIVIERQSYRWFTSPFLHVSIVHCMSNVIMYIFFGTVVERTYGPLVAIFIWFTAATMGSFMAGACGQPCAVLVGASGAVFGYFGFFCADTGLRWNIIKRPTIRILFILMFTAQAIYSIVSDGNVSYWAHIGGCLAGVCCSALLVKRVKTARRRRLLLLLAGSFVAVFWIVFPTVVYATAKRYEICVNH